MSLICSTNCGTIQSPPQSYGGCDITTRQFGFDHFGFIKCDYAFTDILDSTEWNTAVGANNIRISPKGILDFPKPTFDTVKATGCGNKITLPANYTLNFTTLDTATDHTDFTYWKNVFDNRDSFRLFFFDCNGFFYLEDDWITAVDGGSPATVSGGNPGFKFSITEMPFPDKETAGDNDFYKWGVQFQFLKSGTLQARKLPGVEAVLG
jgi:hypothetical protein